MLRITLKIVFAFCLFFNNVSAQNLVPNGSFENFTNCPNTFGQIYKADGWFQPHKYPWSNSVNYCSITDYYNSCDDSTSFVSVLKLRPGSSTIRAFSQL